MSLFRKILTAMLLLSLLPLLASSAILFFNLGEARKKLAEGIAVAADRQASEGLRQRAEQVAESIADYLHACEDDLQLLAALPRSPETLSAFYASRRGEIWYRRGPETNPPEMREWIPRYSSLAIIDDRGREVFVIREGRVLPREELRDVSRPENTEFKSEDYFQQTKPLHRGKIHVTHLTGFHVTKTDQLAGAPDPEHAFNGKEFRGVIRFCTPLIDPSGRFSGIAVLSLDHRHLMEFSQHIHPGKNSATVFPSYQSGNYAFVFDDEGWIITHPKFWDIRGVDPTGKPVPPYTAASSPRDVEAGRIPFNLDSAGFVHRNYPEVANMVRRQQSGYVDITNVGGAQKIMAFAPILYSTGDYGRYGIFGGVTIGFQVDQFRELARSSVALITAHLQEHVATSAMILAITSLLVALSAWLLSRGITRPVSLLTERARHLADGSTTSQVPVTSNDELGELAATFNRMARDLDQRKQSLLTTLDELRSSRHEILVERNFKESILESISSAILTLSDDGRLTSVNGTGIRFLGDRAVPGTRYPDLFQGWDDLAERIATKLAGNGPYGREPLIVSIDGETRHFEVGFFPIGEGTERGITVTLRDETEKERMREEMTRMDRLASLGKLSAGIAHEVRNPLTGVTLLLDDLHDHAGLDPSRRGLLEKALVEIERVERLITGLLSFASPPKARFREGNLNQVIQDTVLLLRGECDRNRVELRAEPGEIPLFRFDGEKIKQVILNLVKNALEALPNGGTITISTGEVDGMATLTVRDTGPGIPADDIPLIFEPFFTRKGAGTGLGLSITQRIVEEHYGRITVESSAEFGTSFTISLPLRTDRNEETEIKKGTT